jgi:hypothetical protein
MTVPPLLPHESFLVGQSQDATLQDNRFVARNFRLDELISHARGSDYATAVLPASDFDVWQRRHARYIEGHLEITTPPGGPPPALDPADPATCPETFGRHAVTADVAGLDLSLSLIRVVGLFGVATAVGLSPEDVRHGLEDAALRDGIIDRWAIKLPVKPVFATLWQDVRQLVPATGRPPNGWADDLRDRLGLSFHDPDEFGPVEVMVLKYRIAELPTAGSVLSRPLAIPTELDGPFFPPFCPAPAGVGVGRVVDLGSSLTTPWPEVLHPTFLWRGEHVAQIGTITRPVPSLEAARARHLRLLQALCDRPDYGTLTDSDIL